ncbi:hypothetical protein HJC23_003788 [Cyclotella cryptica]|uniref:Bacterial alpha-L-rhamnosidase N-terminal domain-containing protein n=1 Tax=Cyclotella cryptica TaxID=29204 RepID=A0ABD3QU29_9STRA
MSCGRQRSGIGIAADLFCWKATMIGRHPVPAQNSPAIRGHRRRALPIPTGRRASFFALSCSVPFILLVLFWQHWQLINRLEGGGEHTALVDDERFDSFSSSYWADSLQQVSNVVQFVAYESGLLSNDDEQDDDDVDLATARRSGTSEDEGNNDLFTTIPIDHGFEKTGSIIPFDLSGSRKASHSSAPRSRFECIRFRGLLPVVRQSELIFRWRHHPKPGSLIADATKVTAYRILVRRLNDANYLLWDSGKVAVNLKDEVLTSVRYGASSPPNVGEIVQWRVVLWDMANEPHSSSWSKLAIGPGEESDWKGKWIVHQEDMKTFSANSSLNVCSRWRKRRPLPLFRAKLSSKTLSTVTSNEEDPLVSGLLVVSGLGSFRASMDGVPLSTSGPIDPPFTDYSKRVMYRGFDVTDFLKNQKDSRDEIVGVVDRSHVIGITMGSGWWDHRPILTKSIVKFDLLPRGPTTVMAQLFLSTAKGKMHVVLPTQDGEDGDDMWQVSRGHIRESDLFTGEIVDLGIMIEMDGWDTIQSWTNAVDSSMLEPNRWIPPSLYETDQSLQYRWDAISVKSGAKSPEERSKTSDPKFFASPIGRLVPSEIPPLLPMERISPDEVHNLGSGRNTTSNCTR